MKIRLLKIRNKIWCWAWEEFKAELSMEDLAEILGCPLKTLYRVVAQKPIYQIFKNGKWENTKA